MKQTKWIAYGMMWLCTTVAVIVGIVITNYAECLFALIIPAFVTGIVVIAEY